MLAKTIERGIDKSNPRIGEQNRKYNISFTKPGITGGNAEFTATDKERADVKAATNYGSYALYFCDGEDDDSALTMTNASIAEVNDNGGLASDGSSVINVYYRSLVINFPDYLDKTIKAYPQFRAEAPCYGSRRHFSKACRWAFSVNTDRSVSFFV